MSKDYYQSLLYEKKIIDIISKKTEESTQDIIQVEDETLKKQKKSNNDSYVKALMRSELISKYDFEVIRKAYLQVKEFFSDLGKDIDIKAEDISDYIDGTLFTDELVNEKAKKMKMKFDVFKKVSIDDLKELIFKVLEKRLKVNKQNIIDELIKTEQILEREEIRELKTYRSNAEQLYETQRIEEEKRNAKQLEDATMLNLVEENKIKEEEKDAEKELKAKNEQLAQATLELEMNERISTLRSFEDKEPLDQTGPLEKVNRLIQENEELEKKHKETKTKREKIDKNIARLQKESRDFKTKTEKMKFGNFKDAIKKAKINFNKRSDITWQPLEDVIKERLTNEYKEFDEATKKYIKNKDASQIVKIKTKKGDTRIETILKWLGEWYELLNPEKAIASSEKYISLKKFAEIFKKVITESNADPTGKISASGFKKNKNKTKYFAPITLNRLKILLGEIDSGNDAVQIKNELSTLLNTLLKLKKLSKKQVILLTNKYLL